MYILCVFSGIPHTFLSSVYYDTHENLNELFYSIIWLVDFLSPVNTLHALGLSLLTFRSFFFLSSRFVDKQPRGER